MAQWFTGTSTKQKYVVGRSYSMGGDTYKANADGTFTNQRTQKAVVGSSRDPRVTFGGSARSETSGSRTAGVGSSRVVSGGGDAVTSGPGMPGAAAGPRRAAPAVSGSGQLGLPETTRLFFGGRELVLDRTTSDAADFEDRWGEGDFLSPAWFAQWGVAGRDMYVGNFKTENVERDLAKAPEAVSSGAVDLARYLDQRKASVKLNDRRKSEFMWADPTRMYKQWGHYPDPYR